jgi:two-component system chemotaxis response regulator CheB
MGETAPGLPGSQDIVVVAASAGGVEALRDIVRRLPAGLPSAIFIVLHTPAHHESALPQILASVTALPVSHARHGERIQRGRIYVAPPDFHMTVARGHVWLDQGRKENYTRPAADPLFRSAAAAYGPRVIGIVLTGLDGDGAEGLKAVTTAGGYGIVQRPDTAQYPQMPKAAIAEDDPDHCLPLPEISAAIVRLAEPEKAAAELSSTS